MNIGSKIKRLRIANQLTLEELANRSELTKGFLSQVERNFPSTIFDSPINCATNLFSGSL